jgi:hypothetical protein
MAFLAPAGSAALSFFAANPGLAVKAAQTAAEHPQMAAQLAGMGSDGGGGGGGAPFQFPQLWQGGNQGQQMQLPGWSRPSLPQWFQPGSADGTNMSSQENASNPIKYIVVLIGLVGLILAIAVMVFASLIAQNTSKDLPHYTNHWNMEYLRMRKHKARATLVATIVGTVISLLTVIASFAIDSIPVYGVTAVFSIVVMIYSIPSLMSFTSSTKPSKDVVEKALKEIKYKGSDEDRDKLIKAYTE